MVSDYTTYSFADLLSNIVDNRGKTCPVEETGLPLIATNCVKNDTLFPAFEKVRYVNTETYDTWFRGHPKPDDIIFVCKGAPGNVCWTPNPVNFCIAQDMVAIRADEKIIDPKFLFALLRSQSTQNKILNMHVGTMIPHFKKGDFKNLYFDIPNDKVLQKQVGEIYFNFCEKIELNRQMNETLEAMAQALFKSWFVDFDPVIDNALAAGNPIPDEFFERAEQRKAIEKKNKSDIQHLFPSEFEFTEEMGWIPKGWEVKRIKDIGKVVTGKTPPKKIDNAYSENGIPFITPTDIDDSPFVIYTNRYLSEDGVHAVKNSRISAGSICVTCIGSQMGKTTISPFASVSNQQINSITDCNQFWRNYLFFNLRRRREEIFLLGSSGSTMPILNKSNFEAIPIICPNEKLLSSLDSYFQSTIDSVLENTKQNQTFAKLRDTLLPKLMSGEIRIPDAEALVEYV